MGRMKNRFLAGYGRLLNRKLRNEPKAAHLAVPDVCAQGGRMTHRSFARDGLPLNPAQKITKRTQAKPSCSVYGISETALGWPAERDARLFQIGLCDPRVFDRGRRLWRRRIEFHHDQTSCLAAIHHRENRGNVDLPLS